LQVCVASPRARPDLGLDHSDRRYRRFSRVRIAGLPFRSPDGAILAQKLGPAYAATCWLSEAMGGDEMIGPLQGERARPVYWENLFKEEICCLLPVEDHKGVFVCWNLRKVRSKEGDVFRAFAPRMLGCCNSSFWTCTVSGQQGRTLRPLRRPQDYLLQPAGMSSIVKSTA
jgi:hypothetical protein